MPSYCCSLHITSRFQMCLTVIRHLMMSRRNFLFSSRLFGCDKALKKVLKAQSWGGKRQFLPLSNWTTLQEPDQSSAVGTPYKIKMYSVMVLLNTKFHLCHILASVCVCMCVRERVLLLQPGASKRITNCCASKLTAPGRLRSRRTSQTQERVLSSTPDLKPVSVNVTSVAVYNLRDDGNKTNKLEFL